MRFRLFMCFPLSSVRQKGNAMSKKIYHRPSGQFYEVSDEQYLSYYREICTAQRTARRYGECKCPTSKLWMCDADCIGCEYRSYGRTVSLEYDVETNGDRYASCEDVEASYINEITSFEIREIIASFSDVERTILRCVVHEITERDLAEILGVSPATAHKRKIKLIEKFSTLFVSKHGGSVQ